MKLRQIAVALPEMRVPSEKIAEWTGADCDFIKNKIGIEERRFLEQDETVASLAGEACSRLMTQGSDLSAEKVDLLILVTQNPDYPLPHTSALLQAALGLSHSCASFDVGLGCSGYVYALSIAAGFMQSQGMSNGLVVTCDPYSKVMRRRDKNTVTIFGDAAAATWLSPDQGAELGRGDFGTDGSGANNLIVKAGGAARPLGGIWNNGSVGFTQEEASLSMKGRAIYSFMMRRVPQSVAACLDKNNLNPEDVDYFVFHQASKFLLESLRSRLGLAPEKMPIIISDYGNTVSSTIPIVLSELAARKALEGKTVMVSGFGVGLSWATNILYY